MSDPHLDPARDRGRTPEPAHIQREQDLMERYFRRFKEYPPSFGVTEALRPAFLKDVEQAIKRGIPITIDLPPDAVA